MTVEQRIRPMRGLYEDRFWEHVALGELRLQRCHDCGRMRYPPAAVCDRCLSDQAEWVPLKGTGRLYTWCIFHRQYLPAMPAPYNVAVVEMDDGPFLVANVIGIPEGEIQIGMRVRVVFNEVEPGLTLFQFAPCPE